jgi:hypothetical protein
MALPLPNLDDRTYADLVQEARALILTYDPSWTNHNPTDPGITLIELFAWLTEMLIYRVNRVPERNYAKFLKLLNGPDYFDGMKEEDLKDEALTAAIRESVLALRQGYRAVTCEDYEALALEASADVARAQCVARRYLDAGTEVDRVKLQPGHISVIIVPRSFELTERSFKSLKSEGVPDELMQTLEGLKNQQYIGEGKFGDILKTTLGEEQTRKFGSFILKHAQAPTPQPSEELRQIVWDYLDPRRVLTTRHHVVGPMYAPINAEILIARREDVSDDDVRDRVVTALEGFLHALSGGADGDGWPFGRDVYVSELYERLEELPGVDYIPDIVLSSRCPPDATRCVAATPLWHEDGDLIGLSLPAHHLPWAQIAGDRIAVSAVFVAVHVSLRVTPALSFPLTDVRRAVKTAVKRFFHPLHGGPDGTAARQITLESLQTVVRELPEVENVIGIDLQSESSRVLRDDLNHVIGVHFEAGELADVQVTSVLT